MSEEMSCGRPELCPYLADEYGELDPMMLPGEMGVVCVCEHPNGREGCPHIEDVGVKCFIKPRPEAEKPAKAKPEPDDFQDFADSWGF